MTFNEFQFMNPLQEIVLLRCNQLLTAATFSHIRRQALFDLITSQLLSLLCETTGIIEASAFLNTSQAV